MIIQKGISKPNYSSALGYFSYYLNNQMASLVIHAGYGGSDFVERIHNLRLRVQRFQPCLNRVVHYNWSAFKRNRRENTQ